MDASESQCLAAFLRKVYNTSLSMVMLTWSQTLSSTVIPRHLYIESSLFFYLLAVCQMGAVLSSVLSFWLK